MKNVAFQNSLRNKDSERFTASLREGGTVIPQAANGMTTENTVKENEPNYDAIETKIPIDTELRDNTKFNEYVNFNNTSLKGSYKVENKLKPESISAIENFTKDNKNVSYPDVYSILYAESSGGQFFHEAAKGPLQIQLGAFVDSQVYQKKYKPVPEKDTPEHDVYMAEAAKDYDKLDELGQVNASLNYLEYLNKRFERNNKRKPTIIESATMYNQGYGGAKPYIADPSTYANNKLLNTYINNVSGVNKAITIPGRNQGGITTEPWGGANGSLYGAPTNREPAAPLNVQEQTKQVFNSTPKLSGGGGLENVTVTGTRDTGFNGDFGGTFDYRAGISSGRPTDTLTNTFADSLVAAEKHDKTYEYAAGKTGKTEKQAPPSEEETKKSIKDSKDVATTVVFGDYSRSRPEEGMEKYPEADTTIVTAPSSNVVDMRERLSILTGNDDFMDIMKFDTANVKAIIKDKDLQSLIFDDLSEEEKLNTQSRISNKQDADAALDIAEAENTKKLFYQDEFDSIENRDSSMSKEGAVLKVVSSFNPADSTLSVDEKLANLNKASEFLSVLEALDPDTYNKSLDYNQNYKESILTSDDPTKFSSINPLFNRDKAYPGRDFDKEILDPQISNMKTLSLKQINDNIKKINYYADIYPDAKNYYIKEGYGNLLPVVNNLMLLNGTDMTI